MACWPNAEKAGGHWQRGLRRLIRVWLFKCAFFLVGLGFIGLKILLFFFRGFVARNHRGQEAAFGFYF